MSVENKVADAILQRPQDIKIKGRKIAVYPPTTATLIMVSECIADLPTFEGENLVAEVLKKAKETKPIARALAIMLLGAKRVESDKKVWIAPFKRISEVDWLTDVILNDMTIEQVVSLFSARLEQMQIGDFFALTTSLKGANLTKPTKEVETAFGE